MLNFLFGFPLASRVTMAGSEQLMTTSGALALASSTDDSGLEENIQTSVGLTSTFTTSSSRQSTSVGTYRPWDSKESSWDEEGHEDRSNGESSIPYWDEGRHWC